MPAASDIWFRWVQVIIGVGRLPDEGWFGRCAAQGIAEITVHAPGFVGKVNQAAQGFVLNVPLISIILHIGPVAIKSPADSLQMEILWNQPRVEIGGRARVVTGNVERPMVHDIVEINPYAETMGGLNQLN